MVGIRNMRNESLNTDGRTKYVLEFLLLSDIRNIIDLNEFTFEIDDNDNIMVDTITFGDDDISLGRADNFEFIEDSIDSNVYSYSRNKLLIDENIQPMRYYRRKIEEILKGLIPSDVRVWRIRRGQPDLVDEMKIEYSQDDRYDKTMYVDMFDMQFLYRIE